MIAARQQHGVARSFGLGIIVVLGALIGYKVSALSFSVDALGHTFRLGTVPSVSGKVVVVDTSNTDDMTLRRPPSITAQQIDTILQQYNSPAVGSGKDFVELGQQYGIDPAYALAFFAHESTAGTQGVAVTTHSIGNIICAGYATCYDGYRAYSDWRSAIEDWYKLLDTEYIAEGLTDVQAVLPVYAPSSENDVPAYINDVETLVRQWRTARQIAVQSLGASNDMPVGNPLHNEHVVVTQGYGIGTHAPSSINGAVDLALEGGPDATMNAPIYATIDGFVELHPNSWPGGNCIWILSEHFKTLNCHMSAFTVQDGQHIHAGDQVGNVGSTGFSSGPHLHYGIWKDGVNVNPLDYGVL